MRHVGKRPGQIYRRNDFFTYVGVCWLHFTRYSHCSLIEKCILQCEMSSGFKPQQWPIKCEIRSHYD
ncbi:hypothetical protein DPMN_136616 [Dreissena polymorpha]|jgi:hypothetical protein|uniref:Uncharacterized protein n=1 Tax=Dreissena polymorpha TaxID=45954 RepID=A0A9D4JGW3_DREPO|nr:hypothetical protein DPMN_136616 [Dreissena polymorpha]